MDIELQLRQLAKSPYWQNLYQNSKLCHSVQLFKNSFNLSGLQVRFLYWLSTYHKLYEELATYEDNFLTEEVIEDDIRCDAYLVHRNKKIDHSWKQYRLEEQKTRMKEKRHKPFKQAGKESSINVDLRRE